MLLQNENKLLRSFAPVLILPDFRCKIALSETTTIQDIDSNSNNKIQKICDELKEHYNIVDKEYTLYDYPTGVFKKTISKDGNDIGGIDIAMPDEQGNVVLNGIEIVEKTRRNGNGTNVLALIFCCQKIVKISGMAIEKSDGFYKKIGVNIDSQGNFEIMRDDFFKKNIERIKTSLKIKSNIK